MVSPHLVDHRAELYPSRRAWLDEQGIHGLERRLYFDLWAALDAEDITILSDALAEALKR